MKLVEMLNNGLDVVDAVQMAGMSRTVKALGLSSVEELCELSGFRRQTLAAWSNSSDSRRKNTLRTVMLGAVELKRRELNARCAS